MGSHFGLQLCFFRAFEAMDLRSAWMLHGLGQVQHLASMQLPPRNSEAEERDQAMVAAPGVARHAGSLIGAPHGEENGVLMLDWFCPFSVQVPKLVSILARKRKDAASALIANWKRLHEKGET